jgi:hypothetical protein
MTGFCFRETASLLSRESLGFVFGATPGFFFRYTARVLFGLAALRGFRAHLSFNFGPQARFFFGAAQGFRFSMPARFLFGASTRNVFGQSLRFRNGPEAGVVTGLHPLNLFCHCPESHLAATA